MSETRRCSNVRFWSEKQRRKDNVVTMLLFDIVRRRDQKTTKNQCCHNVMCQLGNSIWVKYVKRLVLGLNCEYKIKHSFFDSSISIYSCGFDLQSTCYYLLHCPNLLSDTLSNINIDILIHDTTIVRIFLFGDSSLNDWLIGKLLIDKLTILLFL